MAWIAEHTLASAVTNAGGLGLIAGGSAPIRLSQRADKAHQGCCRRQALWCEYHAYDAQRRRPRTARYRRGRSGSHNRCRQPRQVHGCMEGSRHQGDTRYPLSSSCKENGKSRRRRCSCRGHRERRPYRREHYHVPCSSGGRCALYPRYRGRRYR